MIELSNHSFIADFFNSSLTKGRLARSYLLTGNDKEAKFDLVKQINMILNCKSGGGLDVAQGTALDDSIDACGQCQNCRWISAGTHPRSPIFLKPNDTKEEFDEDETQAKSKRRTKGVIEVKQIRDELVPELFQSSDFFRVVIIEDASKTCLKDGSAAALLKTIEEARANTLFMLFAESKQSVLSTIVSRSQVFAINDNSSVEYDEVSKELAADLQEFLSSNLASSRLQQLIKAEEISGQENKDLIAALQILQNQTEGSGLSDAEQVLRYERAISSLKSFVRPQLVMADLLCSQ